MSETPAPAPGAIHTSEDEQILHKMGYAQELFRAMGGFQNFAISFTIISILAGLPHLVLHRVQQRRPGRDHVGLAHRRPDVDARRARDGRDRVRLSHRRRALLLVVEAG